MRADNHGEGGIMALLALVPEKLRAPGAGRVGGVALLVVVGAALLYGDGIITPAISVLSAVEGLGVATDKLQPAIVPLTVAILAVLFLVQRSGTGGLGKLFGPVMVLSPRGADLCARPRELRRDLEKQDGRGRRVAVRAALAQCQKRDRLLPNPTRAGGRAGDAYRSIGCL
jgi:hypothetical protein